MIKNFPLLLLVVIAFNGFVFLTNGVLDAEIFRLTMMSGGEWIFTYSDLFILAALLLLFIEMIKATRTDSTSLIDHALSTLVFIGCLIEFLLVSQAAHSTFFIITMITLVDVVAGYSITITAARRDFGVGDRL